jgi:hypothetical protein
VCCYEAPSGRCMETIRSFPPSRRRWAWLLETPSD